jgi:DNA helicase-2/ATP-dependent DNA helicase PcrA
MEADRLLDGLNEAQRRAVTSPVVPLCILAGAGSGKTRVLTRRIAYRAATGQHDPRHVLALTFTRKAAGELSTRLQALGLRDRVAAGTFHAIALAQLRSRWADRGIDPPEILDRKVGFVARLLPASARASGSGNGPGRAARDVLPLDVVAEIEWAKARRVTPEQYPRAAADARRKPSLEPALIAEVFERYEAEKKRRRMVDFDDLLRLCLRDLANDPELAAAVRWRRRHLFVDEYQDVNPLQQGLLDAWLGDRPDLCVVGDPNQAIYAWNGADARYLNGFTDRWPRSEVVALDENYRSTPQILAVANAVLAAARRPGRGRGRPAGGDGPGAEEGPGALVANRPEGPLPDIRSFSDDRAEARAVARAVRDARRPGSPWSAQAILVRTNAQTAVIEEALRLVKIPVRTRGGSSLLDQPEVKAALRDLRRRPGDFAAVLADLTASASGSPAPAVGGELFDGGGAEDTAGAGEVRADSRQANLLALVRLGHDYAALDGQPTTAGFLAWLAGGNRSDQPDVTGDAVEVATFHAAKGLEWPVVHLAGLEQGLVPIGHAQTAAELAEERRLFYVGVTRAEHELHLSWAESRTFGTRSASRERSPYLDEVEVALDALRAGEVPADWRAFFAARAEREQGQLIGTSGRAGRRGGGRAAGALSDLDEDGRQLFEALKQWRATVAKAASVPAYVVFHDSTLEAIATARPRSGRELLALPGLGPVKVGRYGEGVLEVVAAHAG